MIRLKVGVILICLIVFFGMLLNICKKWKICRMSILKLFSINAAVHLIYEKAYCYHPSLFKSLVNIPFVHNIRISGISKDGNISDNLSENDHFISC